MGTRLYIKQIANEQLEKCYKEGKCYKEDSENNPDFDWEEDEDDEELDLDKAWSGVHFLLTGTNGGGEGPASYLLTGTPLVDMDEIQVLSLSSQKVVEFDLYLQTISNDFLKKQYNPKRMMELEIYPSPWKDSEDLEYLLEHFEELKEFVSKTVKKHKGLILSLH
jgi:hypothetical protein